MGELKEKRKLYNVSKKMNNIKYKVEKRGEVFSVEKYMQERGKKGEEEDIKKIEKEEMKKEKMIVPKSMEDEDRKYKEHISLEEEKDGKMNSFLWNKKANNVEGFQLKCFENEVKKLRKKNLL